MLIRVVETTDDHYIGRIFPLPKVGDILIVDDVKLEVEGVEFDPDISLWKIWNFNYCALAEEIKDN